ncbi:UL75 [Papio ursinus cytomegalovirus]|uniref:UL75 n=1 Tax=Papiine betaherpesvirus 4 TaxID=2560624 RepID=A0A0F7CSV4_9BETA|nr:UL75 [Papio ursinus cytomegalovirus]AKG51604.1 UL75 [Papiine betaherpesvirus 4]
MLRSLLLGCAVTWLIMQAVLCTDVFPRMTLELNRRPIKFLRENSTKCDNNGTEKNITTVKESAITFNFYKDKRYTSFQLPRCLFTGTLAESFLNQVDLSKTLKQYFDTLNTYATVSEGNLRYKYYGQNLTEQDHLKDQPSTIPPPANINLQNTLFYGGDIATINASGFHKPMFNGTCDLFQDSELLFTVKETCLYQAFYTEENDYMQITLTDQFLVLTVVMRGTPLVLIFGNITRLAFKAPYRPENFILRKTSKHTLILIVKKEHLIYHTYVNQKDFLDLILSSNYQNLETALLIWNQYAVHVLQHGHCHTMTPQTVQTAFTYGLLLYIASTSANDKASVSRVIDQHASILLAQDFVTSCMSRMQPRTTLLLYPTAVELANITMKNGKISSVLTLSRLIYILSKQNQHNLITLKDMEHLRDLILSIHKSHLASFISRFARQELYLASGIIHSMLNYSNARREIFVLETGLCTLAELSHWSQLIGSEEHVHVSDLYSPCAGSGRRDHALEHLSAMFPKATNSKTLRTALSVLNTLRPQTFTTFPEVSCISTEKSFAVLTVSPTITYTISSEYIVKGVSFPVVTTVVGRSIIITRVIANATCSSSSSKHESLPIVMIRNITLEQCDFCQSAMVEYDDSQGIVNVLYIHDRQDLLFALDSSNQIFQKHPRTHYLMLLKNGTTVEVTEAVVDMTDTHIALIVIYALAAIFGLYLLYRVIRLL